MGGGYAPIRDYAVTWDYRFSWLQDYNVILPVVHPRMATFYSAANSEGLVETARRRRSSRCSPICSTARSSAR
jgi:hypothetical protein